MKFETHVSDGLSITTTVKVYQLLQHRNACTTRYSALDIATSKKTLFLALDNDPVKPGVVRQHTR